MVISSCQPDVQEHGAGKYSHHLDIMAANSLKSVMVVKELESDEL